MACRRVCLFGADLALINSETQLNRLMVLRRAACVTHAMASRNGFTSHGADGAERSDQCTKLTATTGVMVALVFRLAGITRAPTITPTYDFQLYSTAGAKPTEVVLPELTCTTG
jgi:hypothetical protein